MTKDLDPSSVPSSFSSALSALVDLYCVITSHMHLQKLEHSPPSALGRGSVIERQKKNTHTHRNNHGGIGRHRHGIALITIPRELWPKVSVSCFLHTLFHVNEPQFLEEMADSRMGERKYKMSLKHFMAESKEVLKECWRHSQA